jgi:hypothetical protein
VNDETIRLIIDLANSSKDVSELVAKLGDLKGAAQGVENTYEVLGDSYEVLSRKVQTFTTSTSMADRQMDAAVSAAVRQSQAQRALNQVLEETATAQTKAGGTSRDMQMRILNLGRAAQDLAQGGFGGILNNIEGIVGGGGLAAGVLTAIGTAALLAAPSIKAWVKEMGAAAETFKPTLEGLDKYSDAIARNKKELGELKDKQELTYDGLLKYKDLVENTTKLEEEQANAREARQVQAGSSKKDRERASAVKETIAERYGSGQELIDSIMATEHGQQIGQKRVEEIIAGAQKGFGHDIQSIQNISPLFKERYTPFSPEAKAQYDKAQAGFKREQAFQAEREKSIRERNKQEEDARKSNEADMDQAAKAAKTEREDAIADARRMSNQVQTQGQRQKQQDENPHRAQRLHQVPDNATERQAAMIMAQNQLALDAQVKADQQQLLALARRAQGNIAATNRSNQTIGPP